MPYKDPEKRNEARRKWRESNPERAKAAIRAWNKANPEKHLATTRKWRASHPDKVQSDNRKWQNANPDKVREYKLKRRDRKYNTINSLTKEQEQEILKAGCMFCGSHDNLSLAHDTPVSQGGNTTRGNTFCLCRPCNSKMHTKSLKDLLKQLFF
jgi:hypothetical protein